MSRTLITGVLLTTLVLAAALLSYVWTPADPEVMTIADRLQPPNAAHWLGTDHFGRDILTLLMIGARTSIAVNVCVLTTSYTKKRFLDFFRPPSHQAREPGAQIGIPST